MKSSFILLFKKLFFILQVFNVIKDKTYFQENQFLLKLLIFFLDYYNVISQ